MLILLVMLLNFGISWWNAHVVGMYWSERDQLPGGIRAVMWSAAVMSVCGFFSVYAIIITVGMAELHLFEAIARVVFKVNFEPADVQSLVQDILNAAYLMLVFPVLGFGIVIWVHSMIRAFADRSFGSIAIATYNTGAMIHNTVSAARHVPSAAGSLGKSFKLKLGKDSGLALAYVVLFALPLAISLGGAIATTMVIMRASDRKYQLEELAQAA